MGTLKHEAREALLEGIARFHALPGGNATSATRAAHLHFVFDADRDGDDRDGDADAPTGFRLLALVYVFASNTLIRILLNAAKADGKERPFVKSLTRNNSGDLWPTVQGARGLCAQLFRVVQRDFLIRLAQEEMHSSDNQRRRNIGFIIDVLEAPGMTATLQEWAKEIAEANSSRRALFEKKHKVGPPGLKSRGRVNAIYLANGHRNDVLDVLSAISLPTVVCGVLRDRPTDSGPDAEGAFSSVRNYNVTELSGQENAFVSSRCVLKRQDRLWNRESDKTWHYRKGTLLTYTFEAPVTQRTEHCLAKHGKGPWKLIDPGRTLTVLTVSAPGNSQCKLQFSIDVFCEGLAQHITAEMASIAEAHSVAASSRAERCRTEAAIDNYSCLQERMAALEEQHEVVPKSLKKQVGIGRAHGCFPSTPFATPLARSLEDEVDWDGTEPAGAQKIDDMLKRRLTEAKFGLKESDSKIDERREAQSRRYNDPHLGPLYTDEVHERYLKNRASRERNGQKLISKRVFLRQYVEKRLRCSVKWRKHRLRKYVVREQNRVMPLLAPRGTSVVFSPRLNFHTFHNLPRRVMQYFGVLALANFQDRLTVHCQNIGAALIEVGEGRTTKQCLGCGSNVNVGSASTFHCRRCGYTRPRDIKVANCRSCCVAYFALFFPLAKLPQLLCGVFRPFFFPLAKLPQVLCGVLRPFFLLREIVEICACF